MQVFVTGATGWWARPSSKTHRRRTPGPRLGALGPGSRGACRAGAQVHRGSLADLQSLRSGAAQSDAVIHTAFNHDFSKFAQNCAEDERAIETLGAALERSDRPLLVTSGVALLALAAWRPRRMCCPPTLRSPVNRSLRQRRSWIAASGHPSCGLPPRCMDMAITASCRF